MLDHTLKLFALCARCPLARSFKCDETSWVLSRWMMQVEGRSEPRLLTAPWRRARLTCPVFPTMRFEAMSSSGEQHPLLFEREGRRGKSLVCTYVHLQPHIKQQFSSPCSSSKVYGQTITQSRNSIVAEHEAMHSRCVYLRLLSRE